MNLSILLLILALLCFIVETIGVVASTKVRLLPLGLAFWVLSIVVEGTLRTP